MLMPMLLSLHRDTQACTVWRALAKASIMSSCSQKAFALTVWYMLASLHYTDASRQNQRKERKGWSGDAVAPS